MVGGTTNPFRFLKKDVLRRSLRLALLLHVQDTTTKKMKGTHMLEIQPFDKYFKTIYNPRNLECTVIEASLVLEEKILNHQSKNIGVSNYMPKFPLLPYAPFALAIRFLGPGWKQPSFAKLLLLNKPVKENLLNITFITILA